MTFLYNLLDRLTAFLLHRVLGYRRDVIEKNLNAAFPGISKEEVSKDVQRNYAFLAKIFRQILVTPSSHLLKRKMNLTPCPELDQWLAQNKSVLVTFGHIGNWEWAGSYVGLAYPDQVCALYKKIKSRFVDGLMKRRRLTHVNYLVDTAKMGDLLRLMKKKPVLVLMISDQNPGSDQGIIWADFFGRQTAFVNGPETLALRYQLPVVYLEINGDQNGQYGLKFDILYDGLESVKAGEITQRFATQLEQNIRNNRTQWLWSHRRWKRQPAAAVSNA